MGEVPESELETHAIALAEACKGACGGAKSLRVYEEREREVTYALEGATDVIWVTALMRNLPPGFPAKNVQVHLARQENRCRRRARRESPDSQGDAHGGEGEGGRRSRRRSRSSDTDARNMTLHGRMWRPWKPVPVTQEDTATVSSLRQEHTATIQQRLRESGARDPVTPSVDVYQKVVSAVLTTQVVMHEELSLLWCPSRRSILCSGLEDVSLETILCMLRTTSQLYDVGLEWGPSGASIHLNLYK